jgi:hypothetical protein
MIMMMMHHHDDDDYAPGLLAFVFFLIPPSFCFASAIPINEKGMRRTAALRTAGASGFPVLLANALMALDFFVVHENGRAYPVVLGPSSSRHTPI